MTQRISVPWRQIQSAVWLIGLAIIAWQDWWWPGILILVAISGITQGIVGQLAKENGESEPLAEEPTAEPMRAAALPDRCPNCGGNLTANNVRRTDSGVDCPYCGTHLTAASAASAV